MIDRRIDPDQLVTYTARDMPLQGLLTRLASTQRIGVCHIGPVVYFGPTGTTAKLATVAELRREDLRNLPPDARRRLVRLRPLRWQMLSTPRELIDGLAAQSGVRVYEADKTIPHDLWPAGDLPPLGFADGLTLLAAGFGLTFEFSPDGTAVRFVPIPDEVALTRTYRVGPSAGRLATQFAERFPNTAVRAQGDKIQVVGPFEDHDLIARIIRGEKVRRPSTGAGRKNYTLKDTVAPVGTIIKKLAPQLGLNVEYDPGVDSKLLGQRVTVNVKEVSRDELLRAILEPAGLSFRLQGSTLHVVPR